MKKLKQTLLFRFDFVSVLKSFHLKLIIYVTQNTNNKNMPLPCLLKCLFLSAENVTTQLGFSLPQILFILFVVCKCSRNCCRADQNYPLTLPNVKILIELETFFMANFDLSSKGGHEWPFGISKANLKIAFDPVKHIFTEIHAKTYDLSYETKRLVSQHYLKIFDLKTKAGNEILKTGNQFQKNISFFLRWGLTSETKIHIFAIFLI